MAFADLLPALPWLVPFASLARLRRNQPNLSDVDPVQGTPVSIVVPARNESDTIETVVRSILASTYRPFELLVVDDRSTDNTAAIVERLAAEDPRLRLVRGAPLPDGWYGKPWACEQGARARKAGRFDYEAKVAGLEVPDRYTLRIHLKEIDYGLPHILAFDLSGAVAREVIEFYGEDTNAHPVGSGPYRLKHYTRSSKIVLEANPGYREKIWDFQPGDDPLDREIAAQMKGKRLPAIGNVEISIMEETQSRWLAFEKGESDLEYQLWDVAPTFMTADGKLRPAFVKRGIKLNRTVDPEITYTYFNMLEKIGDQPNPVGGYSLERIALRRAIAMAYKTSDRIRVLRKGQAVRAEHPIPPGIAGYDPSYVNSIPYDPRTANALLDRFGYKKAADGYRRMPDGKPLVIRFSSTERDRPYDELMQRSLDSIAIRMEIHKDRFPELLKLERRCRIMMRNAAWIADYPDGDNFMQLLYGPNTQQSNNACYQSPEFDRLYEKSKTVPDGPERNKLYWAMARKMEADTVWIMNDSRVRNMLMQPRVIGFKRHPALHHEWMYLDLDSSAGK